MEFHVHIPSPNVGEGNGGGSLVKLISEGQVRTPALPSPEAGEGKRGSRRVLRFIGNCPALRSGAGLLAAWLVIFANTPVAIALSVDPATGAPIQLGVPESPATGNTGGDTGTNNAATGNQGSITTTPLPPEQLPPTVQQPTIDQPAVESPSLGLPTITQPQLPVVAPVAVPQAQVSPGAIPLPAPQPAAGTTNAGTTNSGAANMAPGLLDDQHQGLGIQLWQGSRLSDLTALLPKLSAPVTQPSLRDLQLRLLLTAAPGPGSVGGVDSLVPLRAERLHAMGFDTEAMLLSKQAAGNELADPQEAVEKMLQAGNTDDACDRVQQQVAGTPRPEPFWQRAVIFCQIFNGKNDQASIGLDLLRDQGNSDPRNKDFIAVAAILMGDSKPQSLKAPISNPEPLLAAMMKRANLKVTTVAGAAPSLPVGPVAQAAIARDATKPLAMRIEGAEFSFATGLLPADELTGLYLQVPASADAAALSGPDTPEHRGLLYQMTARGQMPENRAQLIAQALREAMLRGAYFTALPLYLPFIQQITPNPSLSWFAPDAARALLAGGNIDKGGFWLNLAQSASANADVAKAVPGLSLLARIAGVYGTRDVGRDPVADWRSASGAGDAAAQRLYGILAGLGDPISNHSGASLPGTGDANIGAAAQAGHRGETVTRALILLAGRGLAQADGASLAQSLGGLTAVGLGKEARRIAVEAAIWSGV